mgnify:CR=1 FL=1
MIGFLRGILCESLPGQIVIDVNGFGINVNVYESLRENLPETGEEVKIFTYMSVKEDGVSLFGFPDKEALNMFNSLISVSSVGPKSAQALLGAYSVSDLKYLIVTEDSAKLSKAPTIGKKTAERIILELKDKVNKDEILLMTDNLSNNSGKLPPEAKDAVDALTALGYDKKAATNAVMCIEHLEELESGDILKLALKYIY